jgi:DNA modification methylase
MRTMNMLQERRGQEMHLCPLQFDIVDRLITQLSMPGDVVFDPFAGLMTVPYCALKLGRLGWGVELNTRYWHDGVRYCQETEKQQAIPTLFDLTAFEQESR